MLTSVPLGSLFWSRPDKCRAGWRGEFPCHLCGPRVGGAVPQPLSEGPLPCSLGMASDSQGAVLAATPSLHSASWCASGGPCCTCCCAHGCPPNFESIRCTVSWETHLVTAETLLQGLLSTWDSPLGRAFAAECVMDPCSLYPPSKLPAGCTEEETEAHLAEPHSGAGIRTQAVWRYNHSATLPSAHSPNLLPPHRLLRYRSSLSVLHSTYTVDLTLHCLSAPFSMGAPT